MAADSYMRMAISQLQTALTDLQGQIHSMQQQDHASKQQLQQEISRLEQERNLHNIELGHLQDDSQKRIVHDRVNNINKQCDEKRARMAQLDAELANTVQRKQQAFNTLQNLTRQLDLLMANPDMH